MKEVLTGVDLFAAVMMARQMDSRPVIIVESPEDCGVIDPHLNEDDFQTVPGYGKTSVLEAADLAMEADETFIFCLVDADFSRQSGESVGYPENVVCTDFYDLDSDCFFSDWNPVDRITSNFADRESMAVYLAERDIDVPALATQIAGVVGVLRFCSTQKGLGLNLSKFPMQDLVRAYEQNNLHSKALELALSRSFEVLPEIVTAEFQHQLSQIEDLRPFCNGHDLISTITAFIKARWAGRTVGAAFLESAFRAAVSCSTWETMTVPRLIQEWGQSIGRPSVWLCPAH